MVVLHDRIAIGPAGVTVIDAKRYSGTIAVERRGGLFRDRTEHLVVGGRDCTALVDGVIAQADAVRHLRQAAALDPRDERLPFNLGNALNAAGQPAEAARAFERALSSWRLPLAVSASL